MVCASTVGERSATAATLMVATILKARPFAARVPETAWQQAPVSGLGRR